jgi:hypothetical protein
MSGIMNFTNATQATGEPTPKVSGTSETYTLVGLTPETTYAVALRVSDSAGNVSGTSNVVSFTTTKEVVTPTPTPTTPPTGGTSTGGSTSGGGGGGGSSATPSITKFTATALDKQVSLTWVNPTDKTFVRAVIIRNEKRVPSSVTDGTKVYEGTATTFTDTGLINKKKYYYAIFPVTVKGTAAKPSASLSLTPKAGVTQVSRVTTRTVSGGSTQSIESLLVLLANLQAQLAALLGKTTATPVTTTTKYQYTRDLTLDSVGNDVLTLQRYLNNNGYTIALTGPGSKGKETGTFWYGTRDALKLYQRAKGLPQTGILDSATRAVLNK